MRISDWSSDVCSSDRRRLGVVEAGRGVADQRGDAGEVGQGVAAHRLALDQVGRARIGELAVFAPVDPDRPRERSEEHTSELQSLMRISYAVFCLTKKNKKYNEHTV